MTHVLTSTPVVQLAQHVPGWRLTTMHTTYALGATPEGLLLHQYWGPRLSEMDHLPPPALPAGRTAHEPSLHLATEEFAPWGGMRYGETALKVEFADGTRDADLRYVDAHITEHDGLPALVVFLRDPLYPLDVTLQFVIDAAHDVITRSATVTNRGDAPIIVERALSAVWHLPLTASARTLHTLVGQWGGETRLQHQPLVAGTALLESRRGITSLAASPWCAISEASGAAYALSLAWSGNWQLRVTTAITGDTVIATGMHDHDFRWQLAPGTSLTTPACLGLYAPDGMHAAQQRLHRHVRAHILPQPAAQLPRPVLYNSWEATEFAVTEAQQMALAATAATLGVELFVMDDGWFQGRADEQAGLGDWWPDPHKFPRGLLPLAQHVRALGMHFGLWVEPEMVNPHSVLYHEHPDWVYHFPRRERSLARHQLVLNLGRPDVQAYLFAAIDRLLREIPITFLKWDMNRPIAEPGWPDAVAQSREIWVRHVHGVYTLMARLRAAHPDLTIESCSSGGGRADLGILHYTDQIWTSDNTDALARLAIQEGFSQVFPARVMGAWVTDVPNYWTGETPPLRFRAHVAMLGALGIGGNLAQWGQQERTEMAQLIAQYKEIRQLVQEGEQAWHHLNDGIAVTYVAADANAAVIFGFRIHDVFRESLPPLRLPGLATHMRYILTQDGHVIGTQTGSGLMSHGLSLPLPAAPYASTIIHLSTDTEAVAE